MKHTLVLCSHNRPLQEGTRHAVTAMVHAGAAFLEQTGSADVSLARNIALTEACDTIRRLGSAVEPRRIDTILMVDDDMWVTLEQAQELIEHSRQHTRPASAMYATTAGTIAAMRFGLDPTNGRQLWTTGLGCLAIPRPHLERLRMVSERFTMHDRTYYGFTSSGVDSGQYWSEDYTLTKRLGGVHLLPMAVGHFKVIPLYPDEETIACVREGRPLLGEHPAGGPAIRCSSRYQHNELDIQCVLMAHHEPHHVADTARETIRWNRAGQRV